MGDGRGVDCVGCVCVCICMCVYVCVYVYVCMCMCVWDEPKDASIPRRGDKHAREEGCRERSDGILHSE